MSWPFSAPSSTGPAADEHAPGNRQPRLVLLFSGHMIDGPGRLPPRFPADKEPVAARCIAETLDRLDAGPDDLGLTQGASGGDILFAEACQAREVRLSLLQPFEEAEFVRQSVLPAGEGWQARYRAVRRKLDVPPQAAPVELGPLAEGEDPFERCNLWLLRTALGFGAEKVRFICLWDGGGGDGAGGTAHMVEQIRSRRGQVIWLDTRKLW